MSVVPFKKRAADVDPAYLTAERMQAYYIALSVNPELAHDATGLARTQMVLDVLAGMHAHRTAGNKSHLQCIALMRQDWESKLTEGWLW